MNAVGKGNFRYGLGGLKLGEQYASMSEVAGMQGEVQGAVLGDDKGAKRYGLVGRGSGRHWRPSGG